MPKMLYKYTTLESLALILKSQKIRLNPLTKMDDLQEAQSADAIKYAPYVFISSWMDEPRESIAMWKLYSNMTSGVRIALPEMPFQKYIYTREEVMKTVHILDTDEATMELSVPLQEWLNSKYTVMQPYYHSLLESVEYTDDPALLSPSLFVVGSSNLSISPAKLGKYKNTYWEFQHEKRYILRFSPFNVNLVSTVPNPAQIVYDAFMNTKNFLPYYDLSIRDDALQQMEITTAPQFSAGNRILLEALKKEFNPAMSICESDLRGSVKL